MKRLLLATVFALTACQQTQTISTNPNPLPDILNVLPAADVLKKDLTTTAANFDAATGAGMTDMQVFALCQHGINQQLGLEAVPNGPTYPSFQVTENGIVSLGSVVIIDLDKLQHAQSSGIDVPQSCMTVAGILQTMANAKILGLGQIQVRIVPDTPPVAAAARASALLGVSTAIKPAAKKP